MRVTIRFTIDDKQLEIHIGYHNTSKSEEVTDFLECKYTANPNAEVITDHVVKLSTNLVRASDGYNNRQVKCNERQQKEYIQARGRHDSNIT